MEFGGTSQRCLLCERRDPEMQVSCNMNRVQKAMVCDSHSCHISLNLGEPDHKTIQLSGLRSVVDQEDNRTVFEIDSPGILDSQHQRFNVRGPADTHCRRTPWGSKS
jgi:hypothetical protein